MKIGDILQIKIEKLVYGLDGLGHINDNFVVFVKGAMPDETVKVEITSLNKSYAKAKIVEIIQASNKRIKPFCPYYNACGSCLGQYMEYDYLIEQKSEILKDIFNNICDEIYPVEKSPKIEGYRHKLQFPLSRTKNSKRLLIGYYKQNSHDITNLKFCKMQPTIIDEILNFIRNNLPSEISCYNEKKNKGLIKNILIRIVSSGLIVVFVLNDNKISNDIENFSKKLKENFPDIKGVFANFNPERTNKILSNTNKKILGEEYIIETLKDKNYMIGPTSFFQVNPSCAVLLFDEVKKHTKNAKTIMDAFGGVGAIGIWVANNDTKITLLEENKEATSLAKENFKLNNIKNFEILDGDANFNFKNLKNSYDVIILDPPRKGASKEGLEALSKLSNKIIYVSCNPMTLKRDSEILNNLGYKMKSIKGFDMFPYTAHIECVSVFEKN